MTKKRNTMFKQVASIAMAMMLLVSMALPSFASGGPITGTESDPAEAAITKIFEMPENTQTPNVEFKFEFSKVKVDGSGLQSDLDTMPDIDAMYIEFEVDDEGNTANEVKKIIKESDPIFAGLDWPHAGEYIYTVTETSHDLVIKDGFKEKLISSKAVYQLNVYVKKNSDGNYYVFAIGAFLTIDDKGDEVEDITKIDPTPQGGDPNVSGKYSQMIFTNVYVKNNGIIDPENPDEVVDNTVLSISKTVGGDYGDETKYFKFDVKTLIPEVGVEVGDKDGQIQYYRAYVVEYDDQGNPLIATNADNVDMNLTVFENGMRYIKFAPGQEVSVSLKHGQHLAFTDLHVGAGFMVTELGDSEYTPSYILTIDGTHGSKVNGSVNEPLKVTKNDKDTVRIGEDDNSAAYLNTRGEITPTGISVDSLPYIVLIAASVLALAGYMVLKNRVNANNIA